MKTRLQITISETLKEKMEASKDFYGGYSGLIEKALEEFLSRPVEPYPEDTADADEARKRDEWIELDDLKARIARPS